MITVCTKCGKLQPDDRCHPTSVNAHQYLLICTGLLRAHGYDIRYWPATQEYAIVTYDVATTPLVDDIHFGEHDPLEVRHYIHKEQIIPVLPMILRSPYLHSLYMRLFTGIHIKAIIEEHKRLLFGKNGAYHKFCEGHRVNHCVRSVIVPGPDLPLDTVEIPFGSDIGRTVGILNRQPSLSYRSIMSVKLRVGNTRCIRFNPQLCEAFNADFDGDEMCIFGTERFYHDLPVISSAIQDYILGDLDQVTKMGLTANRAGIELMVTRGSKGKPYNIEHLFTRIGPVLLDGKVAGTILNCYSKGLSDDEWYLQAKAAREGAASIGVNTPFTGELNAICNRMYI
ncbi:beta and beta-prime subunits of DNA dependent RNA-polymerase [Backusella circina FSU 941]|nr:beta and beta-prime subunits of DNA dependent RNA-polymerase [Backusella circina FSU 941]